jgi:translocation and assembly module TamA
VRLRLLLAAIILAGFTPGSAHARPLEVEITVDGASHLKPLLQSLSELVRNREQGAMSVGAVRRLAAGDALRFARALNSEGYYGAKIVSEAVPTQAGFKARFKITAGPQYKITSHFIRYSDPGPHDRPTTVAATGAALNDSAHGSQIVKIEKDFLARLRANGYPLAHVVDREAEIHSTGNEARLVYVVESGAAAKFGATEWRGNKHTRTDYLARFPTWKAGERYNLDKTNTLRDELSDTGLFTRVEVRPGDIDPEGNAPVIVDMTERRLRTVSAGVSYSTNLGLGVETGWVNRNAFGRAEKVSAEIKFAEVAQSSSLGFEKPRVLPRTDLVSKLSASHEDSEAFRGKTIAASAGLKRLFGKSLTLSAGVELSSSVTTDAFGHRHSYLIGLPLGANWSSVKDLLDPKRGLSLALTVTPNAGASDGAIFFTTTEFRSSYHWPFDRADRYVGAFWTHVGVSAGPNTAEIPPLKRYYAGGAGSVRGYGYRLLGPTDANGVPIGGRSVLEGGAELRFPIWRRIGGAAFFEAGGVDETGIFTFAQGIRTSTGLGVRYNTPIGPLRLDVAVPLDRRRDIDRPIQIYIGLGQAF